MNFKNPRSLIKKKNLPKGGAFGQRGNPVWKWVPKWIPVFMKMEVVTLAIDIDKGCKLK